MSPPARGASTGPMIPVSNDHISGDDALVFTMRELNQQTAKIMSEVEQSGKPAFITKHGRFVAVITPLAPGRVETQVLAQMAREMSLRGRE
jgi:prevent-host-death family protein